MTVHIDTAKLRALALAANPSVGRVTRLAERNYRWATNPYVILTLLDMLDAKAGDAQPVAWPTNDELESLWTNSHYGHPADFAADVLERWGGCPMGLLGYGGSASVAPPLPVTQADTDKLIELSDAIKEQQLADAMGIKFHSPIGWDTLIEAVKSISKTRAVAQDASGWKGLVVKAQSILAAHLPPGGPSEKATISALLGLLDGPEYRAVAAAAPAVAQDARLMELRKELGSIRWMSAVEGDPWDQAIAAVEKRIAALLAAPSLPAVAPADNPVAIAPTAVTTGHCKEHQEKGGCRHPGHCSYPACDRRTTKVAP